MCVAFFTLDHPDYALILCSNRDEHLARPTQPASFHSFGQDRQPNILSGIDLVAGGTWLGLSRTGKLALLTNITEPPPPVKFVSRGCLLSSFITSPSSIRALEEDVRRLAPYDDRYAGFNLLLLSLSSSAPSLAFDSLYVTNHGAGGPITYRVLTDAQRHLGGISNGIDGKDADEWPKVQHGLATLETLLDTLPTNPSEDQLTEGLFDLLRWRSSQPPHDRFELKNTVEVDPLRIASDYYGTRVSTVVLVKRTGHVVFSERDVWVLGEEEERPSLADPSSQRVFRFQLESSA